MELPPRLGVVLCVLQLLLLTACGDVNRSLSATDHRPSPATDHRPPPAVNRPPPAVNRPPPAVNRRLPPVNHRPPPVNHRPAHATDHRLPPVNNRPPPADRRLPHATDPDAAAMNRTSSQDYLVRDCSDLPSGSPSDIYEVKPDRLIPTSVYCDMADGESWTVFQRRGFYPTEQVDFPLKDWEEYRWGFGTLDEEFWWGLHHLWQLTSQLDRVYELRVDLWDWEYQTAYATYQNFAIGSEADGYRLSFTNYTGDARDGLAVHNGMKFTTLDRDNDEHSGNCAVEYTGAWWYHNCYRSNLNGEYLPGTARDGVVEWEPWRNDYSLNATTMKIRPTKKL